MGVANNNNNKLALVAAVCIVVIMAAPAAEAAISCGTVSKGVLGCLPYLRGGPGPSPVCCGGIKSLVGQARTPADRKTACVCLKQLAGAIKGINVKAAAGVPGKCGVSVPFPISLSTDCSKVH